MKSYLEQVNQLLLHVESSEKNSLQNASEKISKSLRNEGIIHVFGCGHSHMASEEVFYRAGGLVPINPIFVEELMLHKGAARSSEIERTNGYAKTFIEKEDIRDQDIVIVTSTSGRNPVPIDVALYAKEKGAFVIGITSLNYVQQQSRHQEGIFLADVVDLVINNHIPLGDCLFEDLEHEISYGSASTMISLYIMNTLMISSIQRLLDSGVIPPVFKSGNVEGNDQFNQQLIDRYKARIKSFV
ncbi:MAG: SIS domain-containing protein [Bacillaceae bacterium]|nr:SIS domain-containing protein [Bacillaceae bacterium]